jgi:hypothetical protein
MALDWHNSTVKSITFFKDCGIELQQKEAKVCESGYAPAKAGIERASNKV